MTVKLRFSLKDPDGVYDFFRDFENHLTEEDKDYLTRTYFEFNEYLELEYDLESKELSVVKRK